MGKAIPEEQPTCTRARAQGVWKEPGVVMAVMAVWLQVKSRWRIVGWKVGVTETRQGPQGAMLRHLAMEPAS